MLKNAFESESVKQKKKEITSKYNKLSSLVTELGIDGHDEIQKSIHHSFHEALTTLYANVDPNAPVPEKVVKEKAVKEPAVVDPAVNQQTPAAVTEQLAPPPGKNSKPAKQLKGKKGDDDIM